MREKRLTLQEMFVPLAHPPGDAQEVRLALHACDRDHRFLRVKGGFVNVSVNPGDSDQAVVMEHCDVDGKVVYRRVFAQRA